MGMLCFLNILSLFAKILCLIAKRNGVRGQVKEKGKLSPGSAASVLVAPEWHIDELHDRGRRLHDHSLRQARVVQVPAHVVEDVQLER